MQDLEKRIDGEADPKKARIFQRFFKTGPGEYGEGDVFLGLTVPKQRKIVGEYWRASGFRGMQKLLNSEIHEKRMIALLMLIEHYKSGDDGKKRRIFDFYIKNLRYINNWDLVDLSAPKIVGNYLLGKDRAILYKLSISKNLWERRIAIIATMEFLRHGEYKDTLKIAELLLADKHDLIHKASGWALRELGKKDLRREKDFLERFAGKMPRTMLRYAIERFPESQRKRYLLRNN